MSKSVLISICPKWCELIASGEKTVEVRKTRPKQNTPFKCYIYETRGDVHVGNSDCAIIRAGNGRKKVIGEFVCDSVEVFHSPENYTENKCCIMLRTCARMSASYVWGYGIGKPLYGWHISQLKIYDTPRKLAEFGLTRPPQSWRYVEEM